MLTAVKLAHGAVSNRELLPMLTHFCIYDGRVQGSNGRLAIDVPCPELLHLNTTVPADKFVRALEACKGQPEVSVGEGGRLIIKSGRMRVTLPGLPVDKYPRTIPIQGTAVAGCVDEWFVTTLQRLRAFVSSDASRPWSQGILFRSGYAWATNNVCVAWCPCEMPGTFVLPVDAVDELLRIGLDVGTVSADDKAVLFEFAGTGKVAWLQSQLLTAQWPDVEAMVDRSWSEIGMLRIPNDLREAVETVAGFATDPKFPEIVLGDGRVATAKGDHSAEIDGFENVKGRFRAEPLLLALEHANRVDFNQYPNPVPWSGDGIRGLLVGIAPTAT